MKVPCPQHIILGRTFYTHKASSVHYDTFSGIKLTSILLTQTWWQNKSSYTLKNSRLDMESMENQQLHNCYLNQ